MLAVASLI